MDKAGKTNAESWTSPSRAERLGRDEPRIIGPAIGAIDLSINAMYNQLMRLAPQQNVQHYQSVDGERSYTFADYNAAPVDHRPSAVAEPVVHDYRPETSDAYRSEQPLTDDLAAWDAEMPVEHQAPLTQANADGGQIDLYDDTYGTPDYLAQDATERAQAASRVQAARLAAEQAHAGTNPLFQQGAN